MGSENVQTVFDVASSDFEKGDGLVHFLNINFISGFESFVFAYIFVALFPGTFDNLGNAFAFGFTVV